MLAEQERAAARGSLLVVVLIEGRRCDGRGGCDARASRVPCPADLIPAEIVIASQVVPTPSGWVPAAAAAEPSQAAPAGPGSQGAELGDNPLLRRSGFPS